MSASLVTKDDIFKLNDAELARALYLFSQSEVSFEVLRSDWERDFAKGIEEAYVKFGGLTWKQRKSAREIVARFAVRASRRSLVRQP